jgi:hypothetical protein
VKARWAAQITNAKLQTPKNLKVRTFNLGLAVRAILGVLWDLPFGVCDFFYGGIH